MKFLITGAAGFLGSALANRLAREGNQVRGLDDLSTGDPSVLSPEVHFTRGDVNDRPKLWTLLQDVDCVYHLAARVLVSESVLYPREYNQVNVGGTVTLMEAMRDVGVKRVVLVSSGAVYGEQSEQPVKESAKANPQSPYAVSKLAAESYVNTIGKLWGIDTVSLRVFNAYGPGQHLPAAHAPVIPNFLKHAIFNGTVVIHGSGKQTRDYVYVDDVVNALTEASVAKDLDQQIINVGSGVETNVNTLVNLILKLVGREPEVIHNQRDDRGPDRLCADLTLAKEKLNYQPLVNLENGLKMTIQKDARFHKNGES